MDCISQLDKTTDAEQNGLHICLPQERQQQPWFTSSPSASFSSGRCLDKWDAIHEKEQSERPRGKVSLISWAGSTAAALSHPPTSYNTSGTICGTQVSPFFMRRRWNSEFPVQTFLLIPFPVSLPQIHRMAGVKGSDRSISHLDLFQFSHTSFVTHPLCKGLTGCEKLHLNQGKNDRANFPNQLSEGLNDASFTYQNRYQRFSCQICYWSQTPTRF